MDGRRRERGLAVDVGGEAFLSMAILEGLVPGEGRELEDAAAGPGGEEAEQVAEVGPGLDVGGAGSSRGTRHR